MSAVERLKWHVVADTSQIDELVPLAVEIGEHLISLYKINNRIYATANICSHEEALLSEGYVDDDEIVCPIHQARFHIPTGRVLCAPATEDIAVYPVRVEESRVSVGIKDK